MFKLMAKEQNLTHVTKKKKSKRKKSSQNGGTRTEAKKETEKAVAT